MPNSLDILASFQYASKALPFYRILLDEKGVDPSTITSHDDFYSKVPILTKDDIFGRFSLAELSPEGRLPSFASAIVSSGTSGKFSFGLVTAADLEKQREMVDAMLDQFFDAKNHPPLIINALPMGVSFVSRYPVVPTSIRTDIALEVIKLSSSERPIVIITDPHVLKKMLEEGVSQGIDWSSISVSPVIGGSWSSDSYMQYVQGLLNPHASPDDLPKNMVFGTMGVTEVGLNLFAMTPDLSMIRHVLQSSPEISETVFGRATPSCPTLMYSMSPSVHVEIINQDSHGIGDIVLTHLDTSVTPLLLRYATGDRGQFISPELLASLPIAPQLPFPIIALWGRTNECGGNPSVNEIKQHLYADPQLARVITGHFVLVNHENGASLVHVQLRPGETLPDGAKVPNAELLGVPYTEFTRNLELSYEHKWKHL